MYLDDLTTEDQNGKSKQKQTEHKKRNSKGGKKGEEEGNNFIDTEEVAENVTDAKRMVTDKSPIKLVRAKRSHQEDQWRRLFSKRMMKK